LETSKVLYGITEAIRSILPNEDSSNMLAGMLWLKGCDVYKTKSPADCLEQIQNLDLKVDVVITSSELALDRNGSDGKNNNSNGHNTKCPTREK
jgi:hypothetical protein